ncbi:DNA-3-methyladenine glycosylase 2 family protein [Egibacter rhizosphaerae]|uniref:DNA-3-methyladenine glycosylase II n=1 Tax=Egibacter rhizosphaerae TaxID=1670831 RepID=A0A411YL51_9ACTN|nr:DNA-3-methyladenine glycosylase 2 family protein [Egibacter rhizosphaerae]
MIDDPERCRRALASRDSRFDGWFVAGVVSTGIYCRPSCPALPPARSAVRFWSTAAAAQQAGFRPCRRCRPDATPGSPEWDVRGDLVARAMRLIADGLVDREGVNGLARALGYSSRQLHRQLTAELGAGAVALARAQRAQTARTLIESSDLPMADVAFAAGFGSVRQFNDTVRAVYATTPGALRAQARGQRSGVATSARSLVLRLPYRTPGDVEGTLAFLATRAIPGLEAACADAYTRGMRLAHGAAVVTLSPRSGGTPHVRATLRLDDLRDLSAAVQRCRRLLDLDADPRTIDDHLSADPALAPRVASAPGRRVPGSVDPFETAVRTILGQQVRVEAAREHVRRVTAARGKPLTTPDGQVTHLFPTADALADASLDEIAMPGTRKEALRSLARAVAEGRLDLGPGADRGQTREDLLSVRGLGAWSVEYMAMRALGDPDALPAGDAGLRHALGIPKGPRAEQEVADRAEDWRPWRAYAAQHLWSGGSPAGHDHDDRHDTERAASPARGAAIPRERDQR